MSDKHTLSLDYQVQQARKVKRLAAENARLRSRLNDIKRAAFDAAMELALYAKYLPEMYVSADTAPRITEVERQLHVRFMVP